MAKPREGEIMLPVIEDIKVNIEFQKLQRLLQSHRICNK